MPAASARAGQENAVAHDKQTLLIVEDDLDVAEMLAAYFRVNGYNVLSADYGKDAIQLATSALPDLIILDIQLPDIEGFEVAGKLRETTRTSGIPIIFLTDQREKFKRIQGLELGADDYITKPFDIQELRLRVRNALRRVSQGSTNNPITNLPDSSVAEDYLRELLENPEFKSLVLIRIDKLDKFREAFGFIASDDVLRAITLMIQSVVHEQGGSKERIGHIGPTDIIVIVDEENVQALVEHIRIRLPQSIELFYPISARENPTHLENRISVRVGLLNSQEITAEKSTQSLKERLVNRLA